MKSLHLLLLTMAGLSATAAAQTKTARSRSVEAFVEKDLHDVSSEMTSVGASYTKKVRPLIRFKAGVLLTIYNHQSNPYYVPVAADSLNIRTWTTRATVGSLTTALEAERTFYRRLSLVAGLELRAGYGSGGRDTSVTGNRGGLYAGSGLFRYGSATDHPYSLFLAGLRPYLGARLRFGRVIAGLDLGSVLESRTEFYPGLADTDFSYSPLSFHGRFTIGLQI